MFGESKEVRYNQNSEEETPYIRDSDGDIGLLNHIIRYGSGGALHHRTNREQGSFAELRKFVLESSDSTPQAKEILDRMFTYSTQKITARDGSKIPLIPLNKPAVKFVRNKTEDINVSVKCPPAYKVIPSVRILDPNGRLLASNIDLVKDSSTGGFVVLKEFSADITTGKSVNAGITPLYQGTYELTYKFPQASKAGTRKSVLAAIASNPDSLGYIFATGREYTIEIKNLKPKNQRIPRKFQKSCDRLAEQSVRLRSSTLKQELIEWNPTTNMAKFRITYLRSVNTRNEINKQKVTTLPTNSPQGTLDLVDAILNQIIRNNSMFRYEKFRTIRRVRRAVLEQETTLEVQRLIKITNGLPNPGPFGGLKLALTNEFFLFRSLLIATVQVFSQETSPFKDNPQYRDALLPKEVAEKLIIAIDESTVPNELGKQFDDPGIDVRSTYETMVIDTIGFTTFYGGLAKRKNAISFADLMVQYFEKLPDEIFKRCIKQGVSPNLWFKSFSNERKSEYSLSAGRATRLGFAPGTARESTPASTGMILNNNGFGYMGTVSQKQSRGVKANFAKVATPARYGRDRELYRITDVDFIQRREGFSTAVVEAESTTSTLKKANASFGKLRIKSIPSKVLARSIVETPTLDPVPMLLISRNDSPTFSQEHFDPLVVQNLNATQRTSLGIVNVNWYDVLQSPTAGRESFKFRLGYQNGTPFSFSTVDNKHLETQAALNTKGEGVQLKAHSVTFTIYDVLSISPYITDFYFSPKFFGFQNQNEDLFGYAGYYKTNQVSITLSGDKSRFETSVSAVVKLDPARLARVKTITNTTTVENKIKELNKKRGALLRKNQALFSELESIKNSDRARGFATEGGTPGKQVVRFDKKIKSEALLIAERKTVENQKELESAEKALREERIKLLKLQQKANRESSASQPVSG